MKILFYGNCQTEAVMQAVAFSNPAVDVSYAGNSRRVAKFDPERTESLFGWCDIVVTQPVMNTDNADHHEVLRARFGDKALFMPYIWLDGFFSLCAAPGGKEKRGDTGFHGGEIVVERLRQASLDEVVQQYLSGHLDFRHADRLAASMAELERRETFCDVKTVPFLRETYRDRPVMLTHNHPHPDLINEIARQIAMRLGLSFRPVTREQPLAYDAITLPDFGKVLTPYGVRDLELRYDYDLQWARTGRDFISQIAADYEGSESKDESSSRTLRRQTRQAERRDEKAELRSGKKTVR